MTTKFDEYGEYIEIETKENMYLVTTIPQKYIIRNNDGETLIDFMVCDTDILKSVISLYEKALRKGQDIGQKNKGQKCSVNSDDLIDNHD